MEDFLREPSQLFTKDSPRKIIFEDFKMDLPITGGWGYDLATACVIDKKDPTVNPGIPFDGVGIEYVFVEKRIYEEMIIFRESHEKYSGIRWDLKAQELLSQNERRYDKLVFNVVGFSDAIWDELTSRFEAIQKSGEFEKIAELDLYRESKIYRFTRVFYFDVTSFFGKEN